MDSSLCLLWGDFLEQPCLEGFLGVREVESNSFWAERQRQAEAQVRERLGHGKDVGRSSWLLEGGVWYKITRGTSGGLVVKR